MADFNQDGVLDIGMILQQEAFGTDLIATALGNGNGTFQAVRTQTGSSVLENLRISNDLEPGDVNGDGRSDLVVFNDASNDVSVFIVNRTAACARTSGTASATRPFLGRSLILTAMVDSMSRQRSACLRAGFITRS